MPGCNETVTEAHHEPKKFRKLPPSWLGGNHERRLQSTRTQQCIWYYKLRGETNYHTTHYRTEEEAREYAEAVLQGKSPKKHSRILKEFSKDFFIWGACKWTERQLKKGKRFSPSHATDRRGFLVNHIYPKFGGRFIDSLSTEEIEDWLIDLEHLSNHTKNQILYTLRIVLDEARRYQLIESNPARKFDPFAPNHAKRDIYDEKELQALFPLDMASFSAVWEDLRVEWPLGADEVYKISPRAILILHPQARTAPLMAQYQSSLTAVYPVLDGVGEVSNIGFVTACSSVCRL